MERNVVITLQDRWGKKEQFIVPQSKVNETITRMWKERQLTPIPSGSRTFTTPQIEQAVQEQRPASEVTAMITTKEAQRQSMQDQPEPTPEIARLKGILSRPDLTEEQRSATERELKFALISEGATPESVGVIVEQAPERPSTIDISGQVVASQPQTFTSTTTTATTTVPKQETITVTTPPKPLTTTVKTTTGKKIELAGRPVTIDITGKTTVVTSKPTTTATIKAIEDFQTRTGKKDIDIIAGNVPQVYAGQETVGFSTKQGTIYLKEDYLKNLEKEPQTLLHHEVLHELFPEKSEYSIRQMEGKALMTLPKIGTKNTVYVAPKGSDVKGVIKGVPSSKGFYEKYMEAVKTPTISPLSGQVSLGGLGRDLRLSISDLPVKYPITPPQIKPSSVQIDIKQIREDMLKSISFGRTTTEITGLPKEPTWSSGIVSKFIPTVEMKEISFAQGPALARFEQDIQKALTKQSFPEYTYPTKWKEFTYKPPEISKYEKAGIEFAMSFDVGVIASYGTSYLPSIIKEGIGLVGTGLTTFDIGFPIIEGITYGTPISKITGTLTEKIPSYAGGITGGYLGYQAGISAQKFPTKYEVEYLKSIDAKELGIKGGELPEGFKAELEIRGGGVTYGRTIEPETYTKILEQPPEIKTFDLTGKGVMGIGTEKMTAMKFFEGMEFTGEGLKIGGKTYQYSIDLNLPSQFKSYYDTRAWGLYTGLKNVPEGSKILSAERWFPVETQPVDLNKFLVQKAPDVADIMKGHVTFRPINEIYNIPEYSPLKASDWKWFESGTPKTYLSLEQTGIETKDVILGFKEIKTKIPPFKPIIVPITIDELTKIKPSTKVSKPSETKTRSITGLITGVEAKEITSSKTFVTPSKIEPFKFETITQPKMSFPTTKLNYPSPYSPKKKVVEEWEYIIQPQGYSVPSMKTTTIPIISTVSIPQVGFMTMPKQETIAMTTSMQTQMQREFNRTQQEVLKMEQLSILKPRTATIQKPKLITKLTPMSLTRLYQPTKQATRLTQQQLQQQPPPPPPIPVPFKFPKPSQMKGQGIQGFDVEVRKMGKWFRLTSQPLFKTEAMKLGGHIAESTPRASFRLVPSKLAPMPTRLPYQFRSERFRTPVRRGVKSSENVFIEKNIFRINTPGELKGITYKGIEALRTGKSKSKKKRPKMWGF